MNIGQVTMSGDNYGACLQAYALQTVAKSMGAELQLIVYHQANKDDLNKPMSKLGKVKALGLPGMANYLWNRPFIRKRKQAYADFRNQYLVFYERDYYRDSDFDQLNDAFDKFICGSDMIWSEEFFDDWDFFYLGFAEKKKSYSYAPSFGSNRIPEEKTERCKALLNGLNAVSCREEGGVELVSKIAGISALQVLDPTMLIDTGGWSDLIDNDKRIIREPYVFAYIFGEFDQKSSPLYHELEESVGKIYKLPGQRSEERGFPVESVGPKEYLRLFRDAGYIVTDTFHGLMFSIIFRKPFLVLDRKDNGHWAKYSDRMTSTLKMLGMENRYVSDEFRRLGQLKELDYTRYEAFIEEKRTASLQYLRSVLEG